MHVIGSQLGDANAAKRALAANGCGLGKVRFVHSSAPKRGRVVAQVGAPDACCRSKVDLVVGRPWSRGREYYIRFRQSIGRSAY